jgi:hypothetical protein
VQRQQAAERRLAGELLDADVLEAGRRVLGALLDFEIVVLHVAIAKADARFE